MKKSIVVASVAVWMSLSLSAAAQVKALTGETEVVTATVEAIDAATRAVTLKKPDGTYHVVTAPPEMKRYGRSDYLIQRSRERYATPRQIVEDKIARWMGQR